MGRYWVAHRIYEVRTVEQAKTQVYTQEEGLIRVLCCCTTDASLQHFHCYDRGCHRGGPTTVARVWSITATTAIG